MELRLRVPTAKVNRGRHPKRRAERVSVLSLLLTWFQNGGNQTDDQ